MPGYCDIRYMSSNRLNAILMEFNVCLGNITLSTHPLLLTCFIPLHDLFQTSIAVKVE